jgi:hypothetical protein
MFATIFEMRQRGRQGDTHSIFLLLPAPGSPVRPLSPPSPPPVPPTWSCFALLSTSMSSSVLTFSSTSTERMVCLTLHLHDTGPGARLYVPLLPVTSLHRQGLLRSMSVFAAYPGSEDLDTLLGNYASPCAEPTATGLPPGRDGFDHRILLIPGTGGPCVPSSSHRLKRRSSRRPSRTSSRRDSFDPQNLPSPHRPPDYLYKISHAKRMALSPRPPPDYRVFNKATFLFVISVVPIPRPDGILNRLFDACYFIKLVLASAYRQTSSR